MTYVDAYKCDICGKVYATPEEARNCEEQCGKTVKDEATIYFQNGEVVNWADFVTGNSPAFSEIRAIKVKNEEVAFAMQKYLYQTGGISFPAFTKDNIQYPVTMVCSEDFWDWVELEEAIEQEEERHKAALEELESWR